MAAATTNVKRTLTAPLRHEIVRALPERPFALRFWDDTVVAGTSADAPEFHAQSPAAIAHFLRSPGELGLGRAYVAGDLDGRRPRRRLRGGRRMEPPAISVADRVRLMAAAVPAAAPAASRRLPSIELNLDGERHTALATPRPFATTTTSATSSSRSSSMNR